MDRVELVKKITSLAEIPFSEGEIFLEMLVRKISDEKISDQQFLLPELGKIKFRKETETTSSVVFCNEDGSDLVFYIPEQRDIINYSRYNLSIGKPVLPLSGRSGSLNFVFHPHENLHSLESKADKLFSTLSPDFSEEFFDGQIITELPHLEEEEIKNEIAEDSDNNIFNELTSIITEDVEISETEDGLSEFELEEDEEFTELQESTLKELDELKFDSEDDIYAVGDLDAEKFFNKLEEAENIIEEEATVSDDLTEITLDELSENAFAGSFNDEQEETEETIPEPLEELILEEDPIEEEDFNFSSLAKEIEIEEDQVEEQETITESDELKDTDFDFSSLTKETKVKEDVVIEKPDIISEMDEEVHELEIPHEELTEPESEETLPDSNYEKEVGEELIIENTSDLYSIDEDIPEEESTELLNGDILLQEAEKFTISEDKDEEASYQDIRIVSIDEELPSELMDIPGEDISESPDETELISEELKEDQDTFSKLAEGISQEPDTSQEPVEEEPEVYFSIPDQADSAKTTSEIPFERVKSLTREFFNLTDVEQQEKLLTWEFGGSDETDKADIKSATKEFEDHSAGIQEDGFTFVKSKKSTYEWSPDSLPDIESITPYDDNGPAEEIDLKLDEDIFASDPAEEPVLEAKKPPRKVRQESAVETKKQRVRERYVPEEISEYKREQKKSKAFIIVAGILAFITLAVLAYYQVGPLFLSQYEGTVTPIVIERNDRVPVKIEPAAEETQVVTTPEVIPPVEAAAQQANTGEIIKISDYIYQKDNVFYAQVSSWQTMSKADREAERYRQKGYKAEIQSSVLRSGLWYRILIGEFTSSEEAVKFLTNN